MWPFSRNRHVEVLSDQIWLNEPAKGRGILMSLQQRLLDSYAIVILAHYEWTYEEICTWVGALDFVQEAERRIDLKQWVRENARQHAARTVVARVSDLSRPEPAPMSEPIQKDGRLSIIVGDRSHSRVADERVVQIARQLPIRSRIQFHSSLDDPVVSAFAGEGTRSMLEKLNMTEDEPIVSSIVSRAIAKAQAKLQSEYGEIDVYDDRERLMDRLRAGRNL